MHPTETRVHVAYHVASLAAEADAERLAADRRRQHRDEHDAHQYLDHEHAPAGVRGAVGRLLIGLGVAIAGSEAEARRAA
jgi:hypothetical protein